MLTAVVMALSWPGALHADTSMTVSSSDGVNLRIAPNLNSAILTVIPFGATLTATGDASDEGWLPVSYNGMSGFVMETYVVARSGSAPVSVPAAGSGGVSVAFSPPQPGASPTPSATPGAPQWALVSPPDGLNLRSGPATSFRVVITAPGGARVQVVGRPTSDGWYSVVYGGTTGWVDGKFLVIGVPGPATTAVTGSSTTPLPVPANTRFMWPVESRRISTMYSSGHPGIDIDEFPSGGNPVVATAAGTVTFAGGNVCCSYGLYVIVRHSDGYSSLYSHLSTIGVTEGQDVKQGQLLGKSGNTGFSTGAHLHFEIRKDGGTVNPLSVLPGSYSVE
ncbi:MAG: peptidoglycan DD-metalloendopeptidase family protein [Dehalococcoidia bacterium]